MNKSYWVLGLTTTLILACSDSNTSGDSIPDIKPIDDADRVSQQSAIVEFTDAANTFQQLAQQQSTAMLNQCTTMTGDIQAFLSNRNDDALDQAQQSYRACYQSWASNALFYQLPFTLSGAETFEKLLDLVDTRPFQPGYIGGLPEYPYSGLIHEQDIPLTASNLKSQHRLMDEESASLGFPVVEFFLWKTPADTYWNPDIDGADSTVISRRQDYLNEAATLLLENLTELSQRWQNQTEFSELPELAKLTFILKSMQRLLSVELLNQRFEESALSDPEWHHLAVISGQGRLYVTAQLDTLIRYLDSENHPAFSQWLNRQDQVTPGSGELLNTLLQVQDAIQQLPENYPFDTSADTTGWQSARTSLRQATDQLSRLSAAFQIADVPQ